jgi:hypothetical protein
VPLHAAPSKFSALSRASTTAPDVLRFGGNRDGKPGGGPQEHVYRVDAPALGARPPAAAAAAAPTAAPAAAAPAAAASSEAVAKLVGPALRGGGHLEAIRAVARQQNPCWARMRKEVARRDGVT